MNKYQYNERKYAEIVEKNKKFSARYLNYELLLLAKLYRERGMTPSTIRKELIAQCNKKIDKFDIVQFGNRIERAVNQATIHNKLIVIEKINVFKSELDYLDSLDIDYDLKKILFSFIVVDRLNKEYRKIKPKSNKKVNEDIHMFSGGEKQYRELLKRTGLKISLLQFNKKLGELEKLGFLKNHLDGKNYLKFMHEYEIDGEIVIEIKDYTILGDYYDLYYGKGKLKECEECGIPVKVNNNKSKYCLDCGIEINKIKTKERMKMLRNQQCLK